MDSDLPLIELSGEDDFLLQQSPAVNFNLACSPLQIPRSHTLSLTSITKTNAEGSEVGSSPSYNNKENLMTSDNKSGMPNLSIEPQRMKRSRKGGGYNLRKSLAWDRAFFTEEGVLDSTELSMITGTLGGLDRDGLSIIDEQGRDLNSNAVGGKSNLVTLEENLVKKVPSGKPHERNVGKASVSRRDSLIGGSPASVSKSSQKIPPRHSVSKAVLKGKVASTPTAPASYPSKRILNLGTAKGVTRYSKIPKFPVSKQDTCLPSVTNLKIAKFPVSKRDSCLPSVTATHIVASESCSKTIEITQPAAQKSVSSKVSQTIKNASGSTKATSESTSKSSKPSAENSRKYVTKPNVEMKLLTNPQAQDMTKMSKLPEMTVHKGLPNGGANAAKSIDGISTTAVSSHCNSSSVDGNRKDVQNQGIKPSGLRMPSPSLRFFSEPKLPISNVQSKPSKLLKSSVSTSRDQGAADQVHDFKPEQLLHRVNNRDAMGKTRLSTQMIDKCSTLSNIDQTADYKFIKDAYNQHKVKVQVLTGVNSPEETSTQSRSRVLDDACEQDMGQLPTYLKDEERVRMDDTLLSSYLDSVEANHSSSIVSQENRNAEENISENFKDSCLEVHLNGTSETNREVQPQLDEDAGYDSSVMNDKVMPESQSVSINHSDTLAVAANCGSSSNDNEPHAENNICNFSQIVNEASMDVQIDDETFIPDGTSSLLDEGDCTFLVSKDRDVAVETSGSGDLYNLFDNVVMSGRSVNCGTEEQNQYVGVNDQQEVVDIKQGDTIVDDELSTMKASKCSEAQGNIEGNDNCLPTNGELLFKDEELCMKSMNYESTADSNVGPEALAEMGHEQRSSQSQLSFAELPNENAVQVYHSSIISEGELQVQSSYRHETVDSCGFNHCASVAYDRHETGMKSMNYDSADDSNVGPEALAEMGHEQRSSQSQFSFAELPNEDAVQVYHSSVISEDELQVQPSYRHETVDSCAFDHCASVAYSQCIEVSSDVNNHTDEKHVLESDLPVNVPMAQDTELELNGDIPLEHRSAETNEEERHNGIIDDIDKVYKSLEEVEDQTYHSLTNLFKNDKDSTGLATDVKLHSSATRSKDQVMSPVANVTEESCSPDNRHEIQPRHASEECIKYDKSGSNVSPREPETKISQPVDGLTGENKCNKDMDCINEEDTNSKLRTSQDDQTLTRTAPNAVPFSDEWLAAIEAAGEEILTLKTGAVQNSPPDKSNPEPSPWSPVKKKSSQVIGPYDCTKYTNSQQNNSD